MRARTSFSFFLARTFHINCSGSCPASATFPIPVPRLGLVSAQGIPKFSRRKWASLCLQGTLHVIIVALNYMHGGMRHVPSALLGRRPNAIHLAIYKRMRSLLIACDRPGLMPMPPGRSGHEFIARLIGLEHFASSFEVFCTHIYAGASERSPQPVVHRGTIQKEHSFVSEETFQQCSPTEA